MEKCIVLAPQTRRPNKAMHLTALCAAGDRQHVRRRVYMTHLEQVLDCDADNPSESLRALRDVCTQSEDAIEACVTALQRLRTAYIDLGHFDDHQVVLERWADSFGLRGTEAVRLLRDATVIGASAADETSTAQDSLDAQTALLARVHLSLRVERDLLFAVTDLLRLRITSSIGYLRPISECFGQMTILARNVSMGEEWFASAADGKAFHNKWHTHVVAAIKELDLHHDYSRATNFALHARSSGTALGTLLGHKRDPKRGHVSLVYQEADDPLVLFIHFGFLLAFYRKALRRAELFYPELADQIAGFEEVTSFRKLEGAVWRATLKAHSTLKERGFETALSGTA